MEIYTGDISDIIHNSVEKIHLQMKVKNNSMHDYIIGDECFALVSKIRELLHMRLIEAFTNTVDTCEFIKEQKHKEELKNDLYKIINDL